MWGGVGWGGGRVSMFGFVLFFTPQKKELKERPAQISQVVSF